MVWQEFPLACNNYRGSKEYLHVLEQEAEAIITKLRKYTSLAFWCGGNELFNSWSKMTDQSHALRLLNKLCYELDPKRPYLPTSPLMGMAHGCYLFRYLDGREVFQAMPQAHYTAYTEFGVPSLSNLDCCLMISEQNKLFPLVENEITIAHHAFKAWGDFDSWACPDMIEDYFGKPSDLQQMIEWSQWLQSEGYKCIYEEARRQKPYCSMALNWCYNEPWPTLANNSLVNYPVSPKPAYHAVAESCRNQLISARIPKFSWRSGETFAVDLWLLNDGNVAAESGQADVWLEIAGSRYFVMNWQYKPVPANMNLEGPTVRFKLPETIENKEKEKLIPLNAAIIESETGSAHEMKLIIECGELSSEYRLLLR
jgi:beta-mannosidase